MLCNLYCHFISNCIYVAVPDRNRILFHCVFGVHHQVRCAIALNFCLGWGSYPLHGRIRYSCVYIAHMSPILSGSSVLQHVKLSDALEIRNSIIFDFYSGLPHIYTHTLLCTVLPCISTCHVCFRGNESHTPLVKASLKGHHSVVNLLLKRDAKVEPQDLRAAIEEGNE